MKPQGKSRVAQARSSATPQSTQAQSLLFHNHTIVLPAGEAFTRDQADPANSLIAEYVVFEPGQRVLLLGVGAGLLATWCLRNQPDLDLLLCDQHQAALDHTEATLRANKLEALAISTEQLADLPAESLDVLVVRCSYQPSAKALLEQIQQAAMALRVGGLIYVVGSKDQGIASLKNRLADVFGNTVTLGYRKGTHVVLAHRPDHLQVSQAAQQVFELELRGVRLQMGLREGVFARGALDDGTQMLIEAIELKPDDRSILDLGCGSGVIGLVLAKLAPWAQLDLVDSNLTAVALAQENAQRNGLERVNILASDGFQALQGKRYDVIAVNPPFHVGKHQTIGLARTFIATAVNALSNQGRLYLVANRFLPYEQAMRDAFGNVSEIAGDRRYKVLLAYRTDNPVSA
jgi:16S rRNA (guanine1207-N2)-methyltransferase